MKHLLIGLGAVFVWYSRSPMEVGRRKKEEALIAMASAIKNVLTVLAVAIYSNPKSFVNFLPPSKRVPGGLGWGKNLRLLQGLL
jgi:hypothetical protein